MATIGNTYLSLIDVFRRTDGMGDIADVVEALSVINPLVETGFTIECNQGTKHRHAIRTGLPSVAWGQLYTGIPQSKSTTQQVDDTTGFVEGLSTVDKRLLDINKKNAAAIRMGEAQSFLEAMSQEVQSSFFYADTATAPKKFKGLAARYGVLPTSTSAPASNQVVNATGSDSDLTSIWFVTWGPNDTFFLTPEGIPAGIQREDKGEQRVTDSTGAYYVKEELFTQHVGVGVKDWRNNARICNIDVSAARAGNVNLYDYMRQAYYKLNVRRQRKLPAGSMVQPGRTVIYMNRDMLEVLDALATNRGASDNFVRLGTMELEGREVQTYRGLPIFETDGILKTETAVA